MSEDHRVSQNPGEPPEQGPVGATRWADYLEWVREDIIGGVLALPDAERRRSPLPSGWTPIELLSHVLHMEQRWFVWGFLGEAVDEPWGDWNANPSEPCTPGEAEPCWSVPADVTAEALAESLRGIGVRTRAVLEEHDLTERARVGGRFGVDPPKLGWICFHVLAEYARHAGHLDIVRELSADAGRTIQ